MKINKTIKNYIIVIVMTITVVGLGFLITTINRNYQNNKIKKSPLTKIIKNYSYSDLNTIMNRSDKNEFIYFSYTNDKKVYELDEKIKKIIEDNKLKDKFIYFDLTKQKEKSLINELNALLNLSDNKIISLPCLVYFRNNEIVSVVSSNQIPFSDGNLTQLIDIYELNK